MDNKKEELIEKWNPLLQSLILKKGIQYRYSKIIENTLSQNKEYNKFALAILLNLFQKSDTIKIGSTKNIKEIIVIPKMLFQMSDDFQKQLIGISADKINSLIDKISYISFVDSPIIIEDLGELEAVTLLVHY